MQADANAAEAPAVNRLELKGGVRRVALQQRIVAYRKLPDFRRQGFEALPEAARGEVPQSSRLAGFVVGERFGRQRIQFSGRRVNFDLLVPRGGIELGKPAPELG